MRIITLWQPWASLIALGLKQYETRSWSTNYRGQLLIHAAKRPVVRDEIASISANSRGHLTWEGISEIEYPLGVVVAIATISDCLEMVRDSRATKTGQICINTEVSILERATGDWRSGRFAWKLENVKPVEPVIWKGGQGLRNVTNELLSLMGDRQN